MRKATYLLPVLVIVVIVALMSVFVVDERERALVLQFGRVVDVKKEPGLAFKIPLVQNVVKYDDRILSRDIEPLEVTPLDDRRLVVDAFARYRIADVRKFRQAVGTGGIPVAENRLDSILRSQIREILGSVASNDILSVDRAALMLRIRNGAISEASNLGLEVIDVRLKRTDLPQQNLDDTFARMRSEREREAADEVARGKEAAQRVRAQADRTKVELVSDAERQAEIIRGEADARRSAVFAEAFGADPDFFDFYRSLRAYRSSLNRENSTLVLSPDSEFFTYLESDGSQAAAADRAAEALSENDSGGSGTTQSGASASASTQNGAGGAQQGGADQAGPSVVAQGRDGGAGGTQQGEAAQPGPAEDQAGGAAPDGVEQTSP